MADEGRGRRQVGRKGGAQAKSALAELAELRKSGAKRADRFEIKEEAAVYDVVDEEQYAQLVQKRREEGGGFVIDEEGLGYDDIGEEFDWGKADEENAAGNEPKQGGSKAASQKGIGGGAKRKATEQPVPGARAKMAQMFQTAALKARPAKPLDDAAADAALDDVLANLDASNKPAVAGFARKATALHRPAQPAARPAPGRRPAVTTAALVTPRPAAHSAAKPAARPHAYTAMLARSAPATEQQADEQQDLMDEDQAMPDLPDFAGDDEHDWGNQGADTAAQQGGEDGGAAALDEADKPQVQAEERTPAGHGSQQHAQEAPNTEGPSSRGAAGAAAAKTPWKTPAPVFADPKTPGTAAPASGWQLLYDGAGETGEAGTGAQNGATEATTPSGAAGAAEPAAEVQHQQEWRDDGTLPVDKDGVLAFYLIDAHEELAQPGTVFLFGKVSQEGHHMSCCAVVRGMQRNLFVVPREEVTSDEISCLEAAAATDPDARRKLIPLLHQAFSGVKAEVRQLLSKHQVTQMTMKPVKREYAFEDPNVRHGKQWVLKVKYPATQPSLPLGVSGQTFSAVFGANQSSLEALMLKRRVMGPGWLALKHPRRVDSQAQVSWCKLEVEVDTHKALMAGGSDVNNREAPPLTMASLSLKTIINPQTAANEVVAASVVYLTKVKTDGPMSQEEWNNPRDLRHFSCIRKLDSQTFPMGFDGEVRQANQSELGRRNGGNMLAVQANERALLTYLLARLRAVDVDVFVGHNFAAFDLDVLLHRLQHHRVPHWSSLGRLKRSKFPSLGGGGHTFGGGAGAGALSAVAGRLLCDTYLAARELVREVDYTLSTLARNLLKQERAELAAADVPGKYESAAKLVQLVRHAESDAWLAMGLAFFLSVLPLTKQLAALSGSLWSKALLGQRAQRIEMLLLHEFHDKKFLLPDKLSIKDKDRLAKLGAAGEEVEGGAAEGAEGKPAGKKSKGPQYAGGLVLEPKKGLYDRFVLLLDFNSLYPSIIQEYNICFTTVARPKDGSIPPLPEPSEEMAVLPRVIRALVQRRRTVKDLIKSERDPVRRQQLEIRQQALKLTANSMYGCLGFGNSRFYAKPLAELITAQGREILQSTVDLVQANLGKEVIYGDTDSIMVYTGSDNLGEVVKLGQAIKKEVNKRYRLLEIEMDGVFKCMLLLKKKKYAAVKIELAPDGRQLEVMEQKGLDIVRRDWCPLSKDVGNFALKEILSGRPREEVVEAIHSHLEDVKGKVLGDAVPLNKYVITKQLTKRPEDYPDAKAQPHVQVALRRREAGKRDGVLPGETVPYVICIEVGEDGQPLPREAKGLAERAYHPEEVRSNPALRVDTEYYLAQQVFPVVSRLCAPISGTDPARLADCLGLDGSRYRQAAAGGSDARDDMLLAGVASLDDEDRYKDCEPLLLTGSNGTQFRFPGVRELLKPNSSIAVEAALLPPDGVGEAVDGSRVEPLSPAQVANQLQLRMRECISRYYEGRLRSDDEVLPCTTRNICLRMLPDGRPGTAPPDPKCSGHMHAVYSEAALYTQLSYYHRLFDTAGLAHTLSREALQAAEDKLAPIAPVLHRAAAAAAKLRDRSGYKWVDLGSLYGRLALAPQRQSQ